MRTLYQACTVLAAVLLAAACGQEQNSGVQQEATTRAEIQWFAGDLDAAFAAAATNNKPIFFYWGAKWCPPCQEIRNTVFKSPEFIELSGEFVAVYLDGDTEQAQQAGEQFGVKGYPTMIVFNHEGVELTRLPGDIDIAKYNDVLGLALDSISPTKTLVAKLIAGERLSETDLKQLAFYSWGQDHDALPEHYDPGIFKTASEQATNPVTASRLYMQYLGELTDDEAEVVPGAVEKVKAILDDNTLTLANWSYLAYYTEELMPLLTASADTDLEHQWSKQLLDLRTERSLSTAEQLSGFLPAMAFFFHHNPDSDLPEGLAANLKSAVAKADQVTTNAAARQSVVSQINYVLQQGKLFDEAKSILLAELEKSESPYYFMSSLSSLAEKQDDIDSAILWRKRAFEAADGPATKLQWGAAYVRTLIRLRPESGEEIKAASEQLVRRFDGKLDLYSGRNFRVLRSLAKALHDWRADDVELNRLFAELMRQCQQITTEGTVKNNCIDATSPWRTQPLAEAGHG